MFKGYRVSREIEYLDQSQSEGQRERGRSGGEEKKKKKLNFELRRESTSRGKWGCSKKANVGRCSQRDDLSRLRVGNWTQITGDHTGCQCHSPGSNSG